MSFEARAKPFGRVDYTKTTEGIVKFKLPGKNFGQRLVALVIIDNQNRVDANAGVALLRENGSAWSERRTQDMAEAEDFIVGQLACKGQYKIRGKLRTPATSKKGDQGRGTVKGLANTSLEGADNGSGIPMWAWRACMEGSQEIVNSIMVIGQVHGLEGLEGLVGMGAVVREASCSRARL